MGGVLKRARIALCCVVVACAGEGDGGADVRANTPADSPPSGGVATTPAASSSVLRPDGIGDIDVGITLVEATDRAGTAAVDPDAGAECRYVTFPTLPEGVSLMVTADTIRRVDVDSPDVLTERGAGIGMSTARIEELYGADLERMPHKYEPDGEYLIITGPDGRTRLVFETAIDTVRTMRSGLMPEVTWVERCG